MKIRAINSLRKGLLALYLFFIFDVLEGTDVCISKEVEYCKEFPFSSFTNLKDAFTYLNLFPGTTFNISLADSFITLEGSIQFNSSETFSSELLLTGIHSNGSTLSLEIMNPFKDFPFQSIYFKNIKLSLNSRADNNPKSDEDTPFYFESRNMYVEQMTFYFKNCSFTSIYNVSLNILKIEKGFLTLEEIKVENIRIGVFLYIKSSMVNIYNSSFVHLQSESLIKGTPNYFNARDSVFYNITTMISIFDFLDYNDISLEKSSFRKIFTFDSSNFIQIENGRKFDIIDCIFMNFILNSSFIYVRNTAKTDLQIYNSIFLNFIATKHSIVIDYLGEFNVIIITDSSFENFFLKNVDAFVLDSRETSFIINNCLFKNFDFNFFDDGKSGIFINVIGWECVSKLLNSRFMIFNSTRIFINKLFLSFLSISNTLFSQFNINQISTLINLNSYNNLSFLNSTLLNFNDGSSQNKIYDLGFIINAEILNNIILNGIKMQNISLCKISKLLYFYYMNSILIEGKSILNLTYINLSDNFNIYVLYWGNILNIKGEFQGVDLYFKAKEDAFVDFNIFMVHYFNKLQFYESSVKFEKTQAKYFLTCLDYSTDNEISLTNVDLYLIHSNFTFYFQLKISNILELELVKLNLDVSDTSMLSVFIESNSSKYLGVKNFSSIGKSFQILKDSKTWVIYLLNIFVENDENYISISPLTLFSFEKNTQIYIENIILVNLILKHSIRAVNCSNYLVIANSKFTNFYLVEESSLIVSINSIIRIEECVFLENVGFLNGLIFIEYIESSSSIEISRNHFYKNEPSVNCYFFSRGGALYLRSTDYNSSVGSIQIFNNYFVENKAELGSALYFDINPAQIPTLLEHSSANYFDRNETIYKNYSSSLIKSFKINYSLLDNENIINKNERLYKITALDYFNNSLNIFDFPVNISGESHKFYSFSVEWTQEKSYFIRLNKIDLDYFISNVTKINEVLNIHENVNISFTGLDLELNKTYQIDLKFNFQCLAGNFFDPFTFDCKPCQPNTMKLKKNIDKQCDICNYNKIVNCSGGNTLLLRQGYFRTLNSPLIFRCKNIKACDQSKCGEKYRNDSFLCSKCNGNSGLTLGWECIDCDAASSYISFIFFVSLMIFFKAYSVKKAYKLTKNLKKRKENALESKSYSIFQLATTNSCLKIINIHFAYISSLNSYPFDAIESLRISSGPSLSTLLSWNMDIFKFSWECIFKAIGIRNEGVMVAIFARISQPVLIVVIWIVYYSIKIYVHQRKRAKRKGLTLASSQDESIRRHENILVKLDRHRSLFLKNLVLEVMNSHSLESITLIALSISYEQIIMGLSYYLFYFDSKEDEKPTHRMLHEPYTIVDQNKYAFFSPFLIFFLIFFGLLVPLYIIGRLKYAKRLVEKSTRENVDKTANAKAIELNPLESYNLFVKYGYFYYQYKKSHYFYEIFYMLRRIVYLAFDVWLIPLISIHTKYDENIGTFINIEVILIWIFYLIHTYSKPFRSELKVVNNLESLSAITLLTSYFFSALFLNNADPANPLVRNIQSANLSFYFILWSLNLLFFIFAFGILLKNERQNIIQFYLNSRSCLYYFFGKVLSILIFICTCSRRGSLKKPFRKNARSIAKDEIQIEINPLAHWKSQNLKEISQKPKSNENELPKILKRKIEILSHLVKYQKHEIKALKKTIEELSGRFPCQLKPREQDFEDAPGEINDFPSINQFHDGLKSNLRRVIPQNHSLEIDVMNTILVQEDPSPNKLGNMEIFTERKNEHDQEQDFQVQPSKVISSRREFLDKGDLLLKESINRKIDDDLDILFIKDVIGAGFQDYFIKTKLKIKNHFDNLVLTQLNFNRNPDHYVKFKRKPNFPSELRLNSALELVFYFKEIKFAREVHLHFDLQISYNEMHFIRKFSVKYEDLDFIKVVKYGLMGSYILKETKECSSKIDFAYERRFGPFSKAKRLDILKWSFPEIFGEDKGFNLPKSKLAKKIGMKLGIKLAAPRENSLSLTILMNMDRFRKAGIVHIIRYNLQIKVDVYVNISQVIVSFSELKRSSQKAPTITNDQLKLLLDSFLQSRLF